MCHLGKYFPDEVIECLREARIRFSDLQEIRTTLVFFASIWLTRMMIMRRRCQSSVERKGTMERVGE